VPWGTCFTMEEQVLKTLRLVASIVLYLTAGCAFYTLMETKACESQELLAAPDYDAETCEEPWSVVDSLYFSMVTMSTVGFGDLAPTRATSKVFTCCYIMVGITAVFVQVAEALSGVVDYCERVVVAGVLRLVQCQARSKIAPFSSADSFVPTNLRFDDGGLITFVPPPGPVAFWATHLAFPFVVIVTFQFVSAAIFCACEGELDYWDAFYHCLVTATTVGYGDIKLTTKASRMWAFFHIALSVSWLAALLSEISERKALRRAQLQEVQMLSRQLDIELLKSLDRNGNGVDKLEFVVGMLTELGAELCGQPLTWEDVEPFIAQFEAADADHSGRLSKEDLALMAERRRARFGAKKVQLIESRSRQLDAYLSRGPSRLSSALSSAHSIRSSGHSSDSPSCNRSPAVRSVSAPWRGRVGA